MLRFRIFRLVRSERAERIFCWHRDKILVATNRTRRIGGTRLIASSCPMAIAGPGSRVFLKKAFRETMSLLASVADATAAGRLKLWGGALSRLQSRSVPEPVVL